MPTLPLGVLVSGTGTNLQAVLDAIAGGTLDAKVQLVVSNKPGVLALDRAAKAGVPTCVLPHKGFASREDFDRALVGVLRDAGVEWIVLAGFMRILTPTLLDAYPLRVINIHPGLLPSFPGVDAQAQALAYGVRLTGCTVHFVDSGTDTGPVIAQAAVAVHPGDSRDDLAHRVLHWEHKALVTVLQWISEGRVSVQPAHHGERPRVSVNGRMPFFGLAEGP